MQQVNLGIDMGGTQIKMGLVDEKGNIKDTLSVKADAEKNLKHRLDQVKDKVNDWIGLKYQIIGVGIAFPGIVDSQSQCILSKYVKYPGAQKVDLKNWAFENWKAPFVIENDARAALIGEWKYGAGKGVLNIVMVTLGTGVGSAVMLNGSLLRGKNFLAGNLGGHMTINMNGDVCNCGNIGCLESESSTWVLKKIKRDPAFKSSSLSNYEKVNFELVFQEAKRGDNFSKSIKEKSLKAWALGIISLMHAFDPEKIIIGGGIMNSKEEILPYFKKMAIKHAWVPEKNIDMVAAEQTKFAGILGVSTLLNTK